MKTGSINMSKFNLINMSKILGLDRTFILLLNTNTDSDYQNLSAFKSNMVNKM